MKSLTSLWILPLALLVVGCGSGEPDGTTGHDPAQTGLEYAPDMYHSIPLEPYAQMDYHPHNPNGQHLRKPADYTIPRGKLYLVSEGRQTAIYPYPATNEGYEAAGRELRNPIPRTEAALAEGKRLYEINCIHCHGPNGNGQGKVAAGGGGPFAGVPSYLEGALVDLPDGKMFHSITYGKNLMGSHATQLNPNQRWLVVHYINELQAAAANKATPGAATAPATAGSSAAPANSSMPPAPGSAAAQTGTTGAPAK